MVSDGLDAAALRFVTILHNDVCGDTRVLREAETLASVGHKVTILGLQSEGMPPIEKREGLTIARVALASDASWRMPWRKISQIQRRSRALVRAAIDLRPDVVHCHDTDTLPAGLRAARATGAKFVYDAHELFPDMLAGHGRDSSLVQRYWRFIERRMVPQADLVITVNGSRAEVLYERYATHSLVVRNVPDVEPLLDSNRLRRELSLGADVPIVLYQGGLIGGRALVRLVRAMMHVEDAVLVMQGVGPEESAIRAAIEAAGLLERVRLTGWVPPTELHEYACGADVGVVIYENTSLNNYHAAPNKLYSYAMAGLPMVASDFPGLREIVVSDGIGDVFDPTSEASIAKAIAGLLGDSSARERMSAAARNLAETRYNWTAESERLLEGYRVLGERLAER